MMKLFGVTVVLGLLFSWSTDRDETTQSQSPLLPASADFAADNGAASSSQTVARTGIVASAAAETMTTSDWPMWGGTPGRNMVNLTTGISLDFEPAKIADEGVNVLWTAVLGSQTYGNPVVAEGKVYVGTNNAGEYRPGHQGDRGVLLCFDEKTGDFLWQLTREKLESGRVNDWPEQGICSTPCVENGKVYVVTNRCEVMCLDASGFHDGRNNGPYIDEVDNEVHDADIIWSLDMMTELGVFPRNLATCSPVIHGDLLLLLTSNGVGEVHLQLPAPQAPSFVALNKHTGAVIWQDSTPGTASKAPAEFATILDGQWSSPAIGVINDEAQVFMPGGDGVLYSFDVLTGELIWWFDLNPKDSRWEMGGRGTRNSIVSTPVFVDNSVILSVGQDPEHGDGEGHIYRIDATRTGDISPEIADQNGTYGKNPNSGQLWHFGGVDTDGSITGQKDTLVYRRTLCTAAVSKGLVYAADLSGFVHCLDFETGQRYWEFDTFASVWGSPMVVDGYVLQCHEDGEMVILREGKEMNVVKKVAFGSSIYSTPTIASGVLYVSDRSRLYAIKVK